MIASEQKNSVRINRNFVLTLFILTREYVGVVSVAIAEKLICSHDDYHFLKSGDECNVELPKYHLFQDCG